MSKFKGDHYCKVDAKGRILFPSRLKKQMPSEAGDVFIGKMNTFKTSLILYPENVWDRLVKRTLKKLNPYKAKHNDFKRDFFKGVIEMELDGSGRVLLSKRFLEKIGVEAGQGEEVVLAGQGDVVELMPRSKYEETQLTDEQRVSIAEEVMGDFEWEDES